MEIKKIDEKDLVVSQRKKRNRDSRFLEVKIFYEKNISTKSKKKKKRSWF